MNPEWVDLAIIGIVGAGTFRGLSRGLIREGMAFAGLAAGSVLAARWHPEVAGLLRPFVGGGRLLDVLVYFLVLLAALGSATLLTLAMRRLTRLLLLGWLDRLGGVLFGAGQGALLAGLMLFLILKYAVMGLDKAVKESNLASALLGALPAAVAYLPPELASVADFFRLP